MNAERRRKSKSSSKSSLVEVGRRVSTRPQKLANLQAILDKLHEKGVTYRTPAMADKIAQVMRTFAFGANTEKEYVRILVDALAVENRTGKEYRFASQ